MPADRVRSGERFTVGALARQFGLSRSTLLHYDTIGLLRPVARSPSNYRLYDQQDRQRLEAICRYRRAGLSLEQVGALLDSKRGGATAALRTRLESIGEEIDRLREQQRIVVQLLGQPELLRRSKALDKRAWVELLRASGMDDAAMRRWHVEFERMAPQAHGEFLASLGIAPEEVRRIRRWSRAERAVGS